MPTKFFRPFGLFILLAALAILVSVAAAPVYAVAVGPGGVGINAGLWLKADAGAFTDAAGTTLAANGQNVQHWHDQWTRNVHVTNTSAGISPNWVSASSTFNFNPSLDFNAGDELASAANVSPFTATGNNSELFIVMNYSSTYADLVGANDSAATAVSGSTRGDWPDWMVFSNAPFMWTYYGNFGGLFGTAPVNNNNQPYLVDYSSTHTSGSNGTMTFTVDGKNGGSGGYNVDLGLYNFVVGENGGDNAIHDGNNAEIVMYNANLTSAQRNQVRSYLAAKYGITLGNNAASVNYTASDGSTIFWTGSGTYQNDVAGIGRDDDSGLDQRVSHSVNSGTQPTLANGATLQTLKPGANTALTADRSFVMWGHNAGAMTLTTDVTAMGANKRMARVWQTQVTGSGAATQLTIQIADSVFTGLYNPKLLISTDSTFGSVTRAPIALTCASGTCTGTFDTFTAGEFFTFGANTAPTNATLTKFGAKAKIGKTGKQVVRVKWETGNEVQVVGFRVWRKGVWNTKPAKEAKTAKENTKAAKGWVQLNAELIAAKHAGEIVGDAYKFTDKKVKAGKTYSYKVEIVLADGTSEWSEVEKVKIK